MWVFKINSNTEIITNHHRHLQNFLKATLRLSQNHVPLLHEVVPVIDILTKKLEKTADNESLMPAVRGGAKKGIAVLNKYYAKTDESIMYRIAISESVELFSHILLN